MQSFGESIEGISIQKKSKIQGVYTTKHFEGCTSERKTILMNVRLWDSREENSTNVDVTDTFQTAKSKK